LIRSNRIARSRSVDPETAVWTIAASREVLALKGLEDSAQGFNPGNRYPERRALKGRQIKRAKNAADMINVERLKCTFYFA
jgi:hypothetical protein